LEFEFAQAENYKTKWPRHGSSVYYEEENIVAYALVTGVGGLVGSDAATLFSEHGLDVIGIDNDMRAFFFGPEASTAWRLADLKQRLKSFRVEAIDIRDFESVERVIRGLASDLKVVVHAAAQPSHDWAARDPFTDFSVNAQGTLNMLEAVRRHAPSAAFIFMSTNKVYGDTPNALPLVERDTRWEVAEGHAYARNGIDETMSIDQSMHSLFGVSKLSADTLVQEYGRYFGMNTACFRGGCLTGSGHSGTELHGFLAYLMKCTLTGRPYTVFGYKGKQVRDNIHSHDLVRALWSFAEDPRPARVYNIGGGRFANCSMIEAIDLCEKISGRKLDHSYVEQHRAGDHIWWVSDISRFQADYPEFKLEYDLEATLNDIHDAGIRRWQLAQ
jgi:CDP-paratose 2-epimerase